MKIGVFGPAFVKGKPYGWTGDGNKPDEVALQGAFDFVAGVLDEFDDIDNVITGGGKGVEQLALRWATFRHIDGDITPPNIKQHGAEMAFVYRNQEIVATVDFAILFWDGKDSKMHRLMSDAVNAKIRLLVIPVG